MLVDNIAADETGEIDIEELTSKLKNDNKDLDSQIIGKFLRRLLHGRGVVLAKKQFSPTVSFSASAREFSSDFFPIIKGRRSNPSY